MAESFARIPDVLFAHMQAPGLVQLTTLDAAGAPFVNVISWVVACSPDVVRLVGDTRTQFMHNLAADGRVALTVYGAGSAWTIYGAARILGAGLPGLPPTFALAEVAGLRVYQVLFLGAVLTQEPRWEVTGSPEAAARFDAAVMAAALSY
ncbi:MAG TPA: pyridoxamine 5'-phosphate oxidase family protein [Symbiobacteriaceae bacterium]|nr:pyridoxamine 5'-phosphate oxidase family protein [Symbiobacteriaceae bacterium]